MTVAISTVNTGISPNDGSGDSIRVAFTKVNNSLGNVKTAVDGLQNTYANTSYAVVANLTVTNQVVGPMNFYGTDTIYINGSPVATSASSFTGGDVPGQARFNATDESTSTTTGAITVTGGAGIGANVTVGGNIFAGGKITANATTDSSSIGTGAITTLGGLGVAKTAHIGSSLYVSGDSHVSGLGYYDQDLYVTGNVIIGGASQAANESLAVLDNIISMHTFSNLAPLTSDDGKDIGFTFHYYKVSSGGDGQAALVWGNDSSALEYYTAGAEDAYGVFSGTYGTYKGGDFWSVNTTPSTSTITGAIRTAGGLGVAGNINAGNVTTSTGSFTNLIATGNINAGNVASTTGTFTNVVGTLLTAAQTNITSVGTLTSLSVNSGGITTSGTVSAPTVSATTVNAATIGNTGATLTGTLSTAAQTNITSLGTLTALTVSGATTVPSISKSGTSGTGDIGSSGNTFGTIYGKATTAQYADLAEKYLADADYEVGTVVMVGGEKEVTACSLNSRAVGAVSANPAYMMNSELEGGTYIALKGRVPVKVTGSVVKGQELVASDNGTATVAGFGAPGVFAIALETNSEAGVKLVEAIIL